jgi:hypothetical protein
MSPTTLPMAPLGQPLTDGLRGESLRREAVIGANVLDSLGRPAKLFRVLVMPLWANHYRVNVITGTDAASVQIPNSYFVKADDDGNILEATPRIRKEY